MAARDSWATQASGPAGILDVEDSRVALGALWCGQGSPVVGARSGFRPEYGTATTPGTVAATGTPDGFVHVTPFQLVLQTGRATIGGPYIITLDAIFDVNVLSTPANATNPRDDLIVAQQSDTFYGDGVSTWTIRQVVGTPAGVPADPAVSGSTDYVPLARVRVAANATTITTGNITDLRTTGHAKSLPQGLYTVAAGGILPVANKATQDALTGVFDGFAIWRRDIDALVIADGATWRYFTRPQDAVIATSQATSSTSFTDLTTPGPAISVETGTAAEVSIAMSLINSAAFQGRMAFAVSGASTIAANDPQSIFHPQTTQQRFGATYTVTGLTPGTNVFTAKYRTDNAANTATFADRKITVRPC